MRQKFGTQKASAELLEISGQVVVVEQNDFGVPVVGLPFVGEGGAFITDGTSLAAATRSCLLSRNPHLDEAAITRSFGRIGIHDVIWLDEPITTGHPDGYMGFLPDRSLLVEAAGRGHGRRTCGRDLAALRQPLKKVDSCPETVRSSARKLLRSRFGAVRRH